MSFDLLDIDVRMTVEDARKIRDQALEILSRPFRSELLMGYMLVRPGGGAIVLPNDAHILSAENMEGYGAVTGFEATFPIGNGRMSRNTNTYAMEAGSYAMMRADGRVYSGRADWWMCTCSECQNGAFQCRHLKMLQIPVGVGFEAYIMRTDEPFKPELYVFNEDRGTAPEIITRVTNNADRSRRARASRGRTIFDGVNDALRNSTRAFENVARAAERAMREAGYVEPPVDTGDFRNSIVPVGIPESNLRPFDVVNVIELTMRGSSRGGLQFTFSHPEHGRIRQYRVVKLHGPGRLAWSSDSSPIVVPRPLESGRHVYNLTATASNGEEATRQVVWNNTRPATNDVTSSNPPNERFANFSIVQFGGTSSQGFMVYFEHPQHNGKIRHYRIVNRHTSHNVAQGNSSPLTIELENSPGGTYRYTLYAIDHNGQTVAFENLDITVEIPTDLGGPAVRTNRNSDGTYTHRWTMYGNEPHITTEYEEDKPEFDPAAKRRINLDDDVI